MLDDLWKGIGANLVDRLVGIAAPAVLFWLAGLVAEMLASGSSQDVERVIGWLEQQQVPIQVAVLIGLLVAVTTTGFIVARLSNPALRLLEGYWPRWSNPIRQPLIELHGERVERWQREWDELQPKVDAETASRPQMERALWLDERLRDYPDNYDRLLPTRLGNVLRAAELRPVSRYGIDVVRCWPQLWLAFPEHSRLELIYARTSLDSAVRSLLWALLLVIWTPLTWLAPLMGALLAAIVLLWVLPARARSYGAVVEAAVDVHRTALYSALRWPLPATPADERADGAALTEYLWRGSDATAPNFDNSGTNDAGALQRPSAALDL